MSKTRKSLNSKSRKIKKLKIEKKDINVQTEIIKQVNENKYQEKNLLKILMNTIISKAYLNSFRDRSKMQILLERENVLVAYPENFIELIDEGDFLKWLKEKDFIRTLSNFHGFRLFFYEIDRELDWKEQHFIFVFRNMVKWFLESEAYDCFIFEKKFISVDRKIYIQKIPKILAGANNPRNFISLNL